MKILTVVGARPQFVKMAPVSRAITHVGLQEYVVHTGQHYDANMSASFFAELEIREPDANLGVSQLSHGAMTGRMLEALEREMLAVQPDMALVYGDTNSTLAGALAAAKLNIPLAHVEAGLRSWNRAMPEEINRVLTDHMADLLFCPTAAAVENLAREGIGRGVHLVGDVMYDAALHYREKAKKASDVMLTLGLKESEFALATIHRAENTDDERRLKQIAGSLAALAGAMPVVFPVHPRTRARLAAMGLSGALGKTILVDPVGYLDMIALESSARLVVTDSGGVQKEAYFFQKPCVTLRQETEWVETVACGWNRLSEPESGAFMTAVESALSARLEWAPIYGDGNAAGRIAGLLAKFRAK
jgi:UDP-GlcNAc3NAcA epimerase